MKNLSLKQKFLLGLGLIFLAYLILMLSIPSWRWGHTKDLKKSVVKVFTTTQNVDFFEPWKAGSQSSVEGCGCVLPGKKILTLAHNVNKGNFIELEKFGETKRYVAKVEQSGFDMDLAILSVSDQDFFKDTEPVDFGDVPTKGDKVIVHGGEELAVKEDTVSGLDVVWVWDAARYMPVLMTDSSIDAKNNGCPVFSRGKLVGMPLSVSGSDKKGYILPINLIRTFFKDIQDGKPYVGFPDMGVFTQDLVNPTLRDFYKIPADQTGVIVSKVLYGSSADGLLKEGDVLQSFDGYAVDNEGYVTQQKSERVNWYYLFPLHAVGDVVSLDILRDGQKMKVKVPLKPLSCLVPYREDNRHPTYYMVAGFVFTPLTGNYFQTVEWKYFKPELRDLYVHGLPSPETKQVVLLTHVLPHEINKGYERLNNVIVKKVNGKTIHEMKDLIDAFDHPMGNMDVIDVDDLAYFGSTVVIDAQKAKQATDEIMANFKILSDRSQDLK